MSDLHNNVNNKEIENGNRRRSFGYIGNGTTQSPFCIAAPTVTGTPVAGSNPTFYSLFLSSAAIGATAGLTAASFVQADRRHDPIFTATTYNIATYTNVRYWIGLFNATPTNAANGGSPHVAFRYSDTDGDSGWVGSAYDGTTQTTSSQIATYTFGVLDKFRIRIDDATGTAYFSVNSGPETSISTNLPASATSFGLVTLVTATDAATKSIGVSRAFCEAS